MNKQLADKWIKALRSGEFKGEDFRKMRLGLGFSIYTLSQIMKCKPSFISNIEYDRIEVMGNELDLFANYIEKHWEEL